MRGRSVSTAGMTDPSDALSLFQLSLSMGQIPMQRGTLDNSLYVATDDVNGHHRLSYMKLCARTILALVQFVNIDPLDGIPRFQTGYAVPENFRRQGFGKGSFKAALDEMTLGFSRFGDFYVEAIVGLDNPVSQRISESVLGGPPQEIPDSVSGKLALRFLCRIRTGTKSS